MTFDSVHIAKLRPARQLLSWECQLVANSILSVHGFLEQLLWHFLLDCFPNVLCIICSQAAKVFDKVWLPAWSQGDHLLAGLPFSCHRTSQ